MFTASPFRVMRRGRLPSSLESITPFEGGGKIVMLDIHWLSDPTTAVVVGIFFGAFTAGFAGFGLAAVAGAFLLHVMAPKVAVPLMMLCSVAAQLA